MSPVDRLAGPGGAVAGAISMAAGEWVSVTAQNELIERELRIERLSLAPSPSTSDELAAMYESHGIAAHRARGGHCRRVMADPEVALGAHAREELGIDPDELPSPSPRAGCRVRVLHVGGVPPDHPVVHRTGRPRVVVVARHRHGRRRR